MPEKSMVLWYPLQLWQLKRLARSEKKTNCFCSLRAQHYNESVALAKEYAEQGKVLIVSPDDTCGVDTLKRDKESLKRLYEKGYKDGQKIEGFLYRER